MCKVAYPKIFTVYKPISSFLELISHPPYSDLPSSQIKLLTLFFLLWPLAIIYYYSGLLNSFILYLGCYKSPNSAIFSVTFANTQCKPIFIISIIFWVDSNYIYLQMTWFWVLCYSKYVLVFYINLYFLINFFLFL